MTMMTVPTDPNHIAPVSTFAALEDALYSVNVQHPALTAPVPLHGRIAAIVGSVVQLRVPLPGVQADIKLVRQPAEPSAVADEPDDGGPIAAAKKAIRAKAGDIRGGITMHQPGLHVVKVTLAKRWSTEVVIAAFDAAALDRLRLPGNPQGRLQRLQRIIADDLVTRESIIAALEVGDGCNGISNILLGAPDASSPPNLDVGRF